LSKDRLRDQSPAKKSQARSPSQDKNLNIQSQYSLESGIGSKATALKSEHHKNKQASKKSDDGTDLKINAQHNADSETLRAYAIVENIEENHKRLGKFLNSNKWAKKLLECLLKLKKSMLFFEWTLNQWFEYTIYLCIFLSMIILTMDNPLLDPMSDNAQAISQVDQVITIIFALEALFRIIALGFYNTSLKGRKAYIKNGSNQIDFMVCVASILYLIYNSHAFSH